ncbi:hypothetical protein [Gluconobacter frateurii]|uniref:Uncharacterized protein n=1 Tax=Gluconobacter frateurii NRIC 0228 TaxID=1307946 RepID=A0ABQ0QE90_9PROT|nr:hypothetical protein [Gluconobacter frateurii]GBR15426.1 hypothetical protein AA0228_2509 [Gluconobacter frateurii NRIC 0228]GLP90305.1 hypothetical protein GCM10007868_13800 [Gluconobacter frateurii]
MAAHGKRVGIDWDVETENVLKMRGAGLSFAKIGLKYGCSEWSVRDAMKVRGVKTVRTRTAKTDAEIRKAHQEKAVRDALRKQAKAQAKKAASTWIGGLAPFSVLSKLDRDIQSGADPVEAGRAIFGNRIPRPLLGVFG